MAMCWQGFYEENYLNKENWQQSRQDFLVQRSGLSKERLKHALNQGIVLPACVILTHALRDPVGFGFGCMQLLPDFSRFL